MYSYEDRIRAVELYIKFGRRLGATIRHLGYPTKNALKGWYREYERRRDLPTGFHRRPKYSQVQKEVAVDHYLNHGRCLAATLRALGYPCRTLLRDWLHSGSVARYRSMRCLPWVTLWMRLSWRLPGIRAAVRTFYHPIVS